MVLRLLGVLDDGLERGLVGLREQQLVVALAVFERVEQVVVAQLRGGEAIDRFAVAQARASASISSVTVVRRCWPSITSKGDWCDDLRQPLST